MATVKELKAFLETIPEDTEVFVLCGDYGGYASYRDMDLSPYSGNVEFNTSLGTNHLHLGDH